MGHKSNLGKLKKIEIISNIFSDHNAMRLDINYKKKAVINTNAWRLNNMFLNNQQVTGEIQRETKKFLETNDNENTTTQNLSDEISRSIVSDSLRPHESQHARPPCPSPTPGVH